MGKSYFYHTNCTVAQADDINEMTEQAVEIDYEDFEENCSIPWDVEPFSYHVDGAPSLKDDWAVHFYKSKFMNNDCFYMKHSMIEYVFIEME